MAVSIAAAAGRLKDQVHTFLSVAALAQVAFALGLEWKNTTLALPRLVALFARQILAGNVSMSELARLAGSGFTPEAFCIARQRLPLELLQELLRRVCLLANPADKQRPGLWRGHRLWHLDGSSFSMPDTPALQKHFGQPGNQRRGCGFPVAHLLCLFDVATGMIHKVICSPLRTNDLARAALLHTELAAGDILIGDCAFESFAHLALLAGRSMHAIFPAHTRRKVDFVRRCRRRIKDRRKNKWTVDRQRVRRLGHCDQVVRWKRPTLRPRWMSQADYAALPASILVRELKRQVTLPNGRKKTLVILTTLLDAQAYPAEEIVKVLEGRWQVEVNLRHLKTTMKMDILRSQSVEGVEKELWMFVVVYNLVRLIMLEAAEAEQVPANRISFADALYWVRHGDLSRPLPRLAVVPLRRGRTEPRAVKRRLNKYRYMIRPREQLRRELRRKRGK